MTSIDIRKEQLLDRRSELTERLNHIEHDLDQPHSKDSEDLSIEIEGDEVLEHLGEAGLQEIRMIDAALKRIETGEYGFCGLCGAEIATVRLDLIPHTPFCAKCAATL